MSCRFFIRTLCKLVCAALLWAAPASAYGDDIVIEAGRDHLIEAMTQARAGDRILLSPGLYLGNFIIDKALTLVGGKDVVFDGGGVGSVISVTATDVTIKGLTIRGSGSDHTTSDSGIFLDRTAHHARVENNFLDGNLIGVYVWGQRDAEIVSNTITGRQDFRMNDRGNGVYVWNAPGAVVAYNDIRYGRDGVFVNASNDNHFIGNRFRDLRFAVHYMYTHDSEILDNVSIRNHAGYSLMFSDRLTVKRNYSFHDDKHGFLLNYANKSSFEDNQVIQSPNKCVFIYNSNRNIFLDNWFEGCAIGVHFTGGSEHNTMSGNSFLNSENQVKYVGTRWVEWSKDGVGNYWSDHSGFDLNGDGISENAYKPNDLIDQMIWRHPSVKSLLTSPAVKMLRWAQGQFPALYPGGVIDRSPMMQPKQPDLPQTWKTSQRTSAGGMK